MLCFALFSSPANQLARATASPHVAGGTVPAPEIVTQVDRAFAEAWKRQGLAAARPVEDLQLARRLWLALVGTIPSLEEIRLLEAQPAPARLSWSLDRLLAERRSAEYLAERIARYSIGTRWEPPAVFRRDMFVAWLADQLERGAPYDAMVRAMIASDGHANDTPAVNFLTSTCDVTNFAGPVPEKVAGRVAQAFVGVNLECAECHDHPFDSWTQDDFRSLAAFFERTSASFAGLGDNRAASARGVTDPRAIYQPEILPAAGPPRTRLAAWVTDPDNRSFARTTVNRFWAILCGKPLVGSFAELDFTGPYVAVLDLLAADFVQHGHSIDRLLRVIAQTRAFALTSADIGQVDSPASPAPSESLALFPLTPLRPEQLAQAIVQAGSLETRAGRVPLRSRFAALVRAQQFIGQFGDAGAMEFGESSSSVGRKLLLMNGDLVDWVTTPGPATACVYLAAMAPGDLAALETVFLTTVTRRPTERETATLLPLLRGTRDQARSRRVGNIAWALINSTEFSWNH